MIEKTKNKEQKKESQNLVVTRGRIFQGIVKKKFDTRVVIEFDRTVKVPKYERFMRKKTRLHARIPSGMVIEVGDYVSAQECRPLSKIIHFVVIGIIRKAEGEKK